MSDLRDMTDATAYGIVLLYVGFIAIAVASLIVGAR